jgi:hypothetical protein
MAADKRACMWLVVMNNMLRVQQIKLQSKVVAGLRHVLPIAALLLLLLQLCCECCCCCCGCNRAIAVAAIERSTPTQNHWSSSSFVRIIKYGNFRSGPRVMAITRLGHRWRWWCCCGCNRAIAVGVGLQIWHARKKKSHKYILPRPHKTIGPAVRSCASSSTATSGLDHLNKGGLRAPAPPGEAPACAAPPWGDPPREASRGVSPLASRGFVPPGSDCGEGAPPGEAHARLGAVPPAGEARQGGPPGSPIG